MRASFRRSGFTLLELLIVIAVILILIAIAVPNFLAAAIRARVARSSQDLQTIAIALEAYRIDFGIYPMDHHGIWPAVQPESYGYILLTTPVPYLNSVPLDPFGPLDTTNPEVQGYTNTFYGGSGSDNLDCGGKDRYLNPTSARNGPDCAHGFLLFGLGPEKQIAVKPWERYPAGDPPDLYPGVIRIYSPAMGPHSSGNIVKMIGEQRNENWKVIIHDQPGDPRQ